MVLTMVIKILTMSFLALVIFACGEDKSNSSSDNGVTDKAPIISSDKQLNISILLDLSDRLVQNVIPSAKERDIEIIKTITKLFSQNMKTKGTFRSKDKIHILFNPAPADPQINSIARDLKVDLSNMDPKQKKIIYDTIDSSFAKNLSTIYDLTLHSKDWVGSDIWRFFKNDVKDYCIDTNPEYRNILVILTDGYIYHKQSTDRVKNRTAYITSSFLSQEGFRNKNNWKNIFDNADYGFITTRKDLNNLEVLILEVNPSAGYKNDEDLIRAYLSKWFNEMGINKFQIYNTDLPSNTSQRIVNFFN